MTSENSLVFSKYLNLLLFFLANLLIVSFISTIKIDYTHENILHFDLNLKFDLGLSLQVILLTVFLQVIILYLGIISMFRQKDVIQIFPENNMTPYITQSMGIYSYDIPKLIKTVFSVAEKSQVEIKRIFLTITPIPNAFTLHIPLLGSIININSNILDFLDQQEVEAVIAHEIGHIKGKDSFLRLLIVSPSTYLHFSFIYLYIVLFAGIIDSFIIQEDAWATCIRILFFVFVYILIRLITTILMLFLRKGQRVSEMLCDIHAARMTSPLVTINMLIHLGQRTEVIHVLLNEFKNMELLQPKNISLGDQQRLLSFVKYFPLYELDERKAQIAAPILYIIGQLRYLAQYYLIPLSEPTIKKLALESVHNLINEQKLVNTSEDLEKIKKMTQDWREFDWN
ncbi:MAG: M48 family metallopeptidase, partial [Candidatus Hodarchaeota archaeon]